MSISRINPSKSANKNSHSRVSFIDEENDAARYTMGNRNGKY